MNVIRWPAENAYKMAFHATDFDGLYKKIHDAAMTGKTWIEADINLIAQKHFEKKGYRVSAYGNNKKIAWDNPKISLWKRLKRIFWFDQEGLD